MKTEEIIKWYQCKRDFGITVSILLLFGIAIRHFDIYENFEIYVWAALKAKTGIYPNMVVDLFFEWGFWLPAFAVLIASMFVCLKHYWSWLVITLLGVSFFLTIYSSNNLEGTMRTIDILKKEFSDICSILYFLRDFSTYVLFSSPFAAVVSVIIFGIRKKYISNQVGEGSRLQQ